MPYPNEFTKSQLAKVGVSLLDDRRGELKCNVCGSTWQVIKRGMRLPKGYWRCQNGCNSKQDGKAQSTPPAAADGDGHRPAVNDDTPNRLHFI